MPKTHRDRPPTYSYPIGVLPAPPPTAEQPSEVSEAPPPTPPAASARITAWRVYARKVGVDPTGMSKTQIREAVG